MRICVARRELFSGTISSCVHWVDAFFVNPQNNVDARVIVGTDTKLELEAL